MATEQSGSTDRGDRARGLAFAVCAGAYALALLVALGVGWALPAWHPIAIAAMADLAATIAVFACSVLLSNSSMYDAYWSAAPLPIGIYYLSAVNSGAGAAHTRGLLVLALVLLWGVRLTWNWARGWRGLDHEDWRYVDIREKSGRLYWPVSLIGIHLMPTAVVFLGCLSLYAVAAGAAPLGWLDGLAGAVTLAAIVLEAVADQQLRRFTTSAPAPGAILDRGLWAVVRHPNYAGEILFWCGLFLFALAADRGAGWTALGPSSMVALFVLVSVPMIDARMRKRRPGYVEHMRRVPALLPGIRRGRAG